MSLEDTTCQQPREEAAPLSLLIVADTTVQSIALPALGAVILGRARECDVPVGDPSISRRHARLHLAPLRLEDLGSANGTRVGGRRLARGEVVELAPGSSFSLGEVIFFVKRAKSHGSGIEVRTDDYFEARLAAECTRSRKYALRFALLTLSAAASEGALEEAVRAEARPSDLVGSMTRGEARMLLPHATREEAESLAARVCGRLGAAECEIGIALCPEDAQESGDLLAHARSHAAPRALRAREEGSVPVATDAASCAILERVVRLGASEFPVLFTGEEGVGKRTFAAWMHARSRRARRPLLRVTCLGVSEAALEAELFGIEAGPEAREGALERADGGALLLEHIDTLPRAIESRLTHALEYGQVFRVGGITPRRVRLRFLATALRRPEKRDFVRRLAGAVVEVPPLRDRPADIEPLARRFATAAVAFGPGALEALRGYSWPGNVAELRLAVEHAAAAAIEGQIEVGDLDLPEHAPPSGLALRADLEQLERMRIEAALAASGGNRSRAARALGIARNTLLARLKSYGI